MPSNLGQANPTRLPRSQLHVFLQRVQCEQGYRRESSVLVAFTLRRVNLSLFELGPTFLEPDPPNPFPAARHALQARGHHAIGRPQPARAAASFGTTRDT